MYFIKRFLLLVVVSLVLAAAWLAWFAFDPLPLRTSPLDFSITPGSSLRGASQQMTDAGVGFSAWQFTLLARLMGRAGAIKAGSYEIERGITPMHLLGMLSRGDVTFDEIVFVEGKTFQQMRAQLDAHPQVRHETAGLTNREIMARLGAVESHPEGLFFPDTYLFAKQSSDLAILQRAYRAMQGHLQREWQERDTALPYAAPYAALIMASIVEKETGMPADRLQVAAVFVNRLRLGMLLQTDPTVVYGMGMRFDGNIRKRDLLADTPYNTYTRPGLPPTPIAMPGLASLRATLHPARSDVLYFVARQDGTGGSYFSRSLEEHNRAVNKYLRRRGR